MCTMCIRGGKKHLLFNLIRLTSLSHSMTHPKNINFSSEVIWEVLAPERRFWPNYTKDFQNLGRKNISACIFNF